MADVDGGRTSLLQAARALKARILADRERIEAGRRLPQDLSKIVQFSNYLLCLRRDRRPAPAGAGGGEPRRGGDGC